MKTPAASLIHRRTLLALAAAGSVAGCGFRLRQAPNFVFNTIIINAPGNSPLANELRRNLLADGKVQVLLNTPLPATPAPVPELTPTPALTPALTPLPMPVPPASVASAPASAASAPASAASAPGDGRVVVILDVLQEQREKVVVGLNASGQVREFQLRTRLQFRVRTPQGRELIPPTELLQTRDISFNEAAVLSKEAEEALLYRDMQSDLVQQLLRRLAALRSA